MNDPDREYVVQISLRQKIELDKWLETPNGAHTIGERLTIEAVENGGLLIRTMPYKAPRTQSNP